MTNETVLNTQWHAAYAAQLAAEEQKRPFMLLRPRIFRDGNQWCALLGDNIMEGVCGFGDSPDLASRDFDVQWYKPVADQPKETTDVLDKTKTRAAFRRYLNALPGENYKNGRYEQRTRPYGDYLYAQDREKFEWEYQEWLKADAGQGG